MFKKFRLHPVINESGLMRYGWCMICTGELFASSIWDLHFLFEDVQEVGSPICDSCYDGLKYKIPEKLDVLEKKYQKREKKYKLISEIQKELDQWI